MRPRFLRIPAALVGIALLAGVFAAPAAGETTNRALERVVAKGSFSADDGVRLQRAFSAALRAGVGQRDALALAEASVEGRFSASQALRVLSIAAQLALESLPIDAFVAKVEEGVSKRVAPDRVVEVAERRALMLNQAKLILNSLVLQGLSIGDRDKLLPNLAAALEAGRSSEDIRRTLAAAFEAGESVGRIRDRLFP